VRAGLGDLSKRRRPLLSEVFDRDALPGRRRVHLFPAAGAVPATRQGGHPDPAPHGGTTAETDPGAERVPPGIRVLGQVAGAGIHGVVVAADTNWHAVAAPGYRGITSELLIHTTADGPIEARFSGIVELTRTVRTVISGGVRLTEYGDQYFFTHADLHARASAHDWINHTIFVAEGRLLPGPMIEYRLYQLALTP
jgi:hypothetical protein